MHKDLYKSGFINLKTEDSYSLKIYLSDGREIHSTPQTLKKTVQNISDTVLAKEYLTSKGQFESLLAANIAHIPCISFQDFKNEENFYLLKEVGVGSSIALNSLRFFFGRKHQRCLRDPF